MLIITAKVRLQTGTREEFLDAYRWMRPLVMQDPGAILYELHCSAEDPDEFIFYEHYESEQAFEYHLSTEHFKALSARIDPLMEGPPEIGTWAEVV